MRNEMYSRGYGLYDQGYSLGQVAAVLGVTRQSVYSGFKRRGFKMRTKRLLPFVVYRGRKFTIANTGYYRSTDRREEMLLHRFVWKSEVGEIPDGYDVHHIDGDKKNNDLSNLECLPKAEHTRRYSPHCNQYKCNCKKHA